MTSADRLLAAEKQFSELADQLQKLKSAAQAIEQAGHATGQMRALAESAIATASSLGEKIGHTAQVIEKQNIPERLLENESRLNLKLLEINDLGQSLLRSAERETKTQRDLTNEVKDLVVALDARVGHELEKTAKMLRVLLLLQILLAVLLTCMILRC